MVHLSWPLRAHMSGGGCLSGSIAAGLLHLLGTREISESRAWLPLRLALRQPPVRRLIASLPCFHLRGPCLSRGLCYLVSARFSAPRLRLLAFARICSRNLVSSFSLKPHVDFLGARGRRLLSRRNGGRKSSLPSALQRVTFRHVAERSVAWFFFSLLGRRCAKGAHSENERHACRDAGGERDRPTQSDPK